MNITYYGHSCFEVDLDGIKLIFDPFITPNPHASGIDVSAIRADYILLSHGHEDHLADVETIFKNSNCRIISTFEIVSWFQSKGLENGHPMNHGGKWSFDFGDVKMVSAIHSSSMPDGSYGGNPAGFVITAGNTRFYYAGDTALTYDMKLIPENGKIDFAFLPVGDNFTMGIEDAAKAASFIEANKVVAMHFDTFPYIEIDKNQAREVFEKNQIELILPEIGKSIEI